MTLLSREAVHFLEEQFAQRNPHVKAITSKGSILDTISFRSEEMGKNKVMNLKKKSGVAFNKKKRFYFVHPVSY